MGFQVMLTGRSVFILSNSYPQTNPVFWLSIVCSFRGGIMAYIKNYGHFTWPQSWNFKLIFYMFTFLYNLATWCEELTHLKRRWCWERLRAGGGGDDRGWDGWMASLTQWTWVWVGSRSWWWTGRPGVLQFMGLPRVRHDWATELNWTELMHELCYSERGKGMTEGISCYY